MTDFTATLPRKRIGAGLLMTDLTGRALLVEPVYKPDWELPRGVVEADESPRDTAIREIGEELGLAVSPGRLLVVDWVPPREGRTEGLMLLFDGGSSTRRRPARSGCHPMSCAAGPGATDSKPSNTSLHSPLGA
ncbi:NUDIX hydrolase [Actinoplanes sp. NPDC026619]|uniref:NUDIX hydrolase n=1 Tax=Actinoplanes sp. NPDC026619 TaxID=3155798 RepID=UPI0033DFB336